MLRESPEAAENNTNGVAHPRLLFAKGCVNLHLIFMTSRVYDVAAHRLDRTKYVCIYVLQIRVHFIINKALDDGDAFGYAL